MDPVELTGSPRLVRETVYATLVDAAERFAQYIDRYEHGEIEIERVQEQAPARRQLADATESVWPRGDHFIPRK